MSKTYKGWELMKAIADGEIKEGSLISFDNIIWIVDEYSDIVKHQKEYITLFNTYKAIEIANGEFRIINDEINIDNIEEYKQEHTERCIDIDIRNKINELIKAVKQIDKRVKKLEE